MKLNDIDIAIKAIEKQVPRKPNTRRYATGTYTTCPSCNTRVLTKYCTECGQRIKWE